VDLASFPHGKGFEGWGLTGPADQDGQEQGRDQHQGEGISLQGEGREGEKGLDRAAGWLDASNAILDGWDWLEGGPAETDLVEAAGPGTGNLAGHTFQNLQEGPSSRVGADLPERAAQEAAEGQEGPSLGLGAGRRADQAVPASSCLDLDEGLSSGVGTGLPEGAAGVAGGLEVVPRDGMELDAREASGAFCFNLNGGPGSGVLCPSGASPRGFLAAGLQPSGTFVSRGAGLLSQARTRARAFALLPGFGLGLDRAALPRRKARPGECGVACE